MTSVVERLTIGPDVSHALTAHTSDLVSIVEADGTIRYASPSYQRILGYPPAALQGISAFDHVHPDDVGRVQAAFAAALHADDGAPVRVQCRYRHADGSWRVLETTSSSHLADPLIHGFIATSRDITEQVQAERQLQEKEAQYRSIFEATGDGLVIADLDGVVVEANPAYCAMYGYRYDEMIGRRLSTLSTPDYYPKLIEHLDTIRAGGSIAARGTSVRKDGSLFHVEARGTTFIYKGRPHILGVDRDITAQMHAEEQLREKEEQYRGIFEATNDALIITDPDGFCVEANPAACRMYGYTYEEMIGLHAAMATHPDYHDLARAFVEAIGAGGSMAAGSLALRKDGTPFPIETRASRFMFRGTSHILAVVRDITERVQTQEELEQRVTERTRELAALLEVSHNVASTLEVQPLLGLILDQLKTLVEYTGAAIWQLAADGEELINLDYRGPLSREEVMRLRFPLGQEWPDRAVIDGRKPVIVNDARGQSALAQAFQAAMGRLPDRHFDYIRSWMGIPLIHKDRVIGTMVLVYKEPGYYTPRHAELALAVAQQATLAIENARLYEQAQHVAAVEERQRLARELHDSVSQALYSIGLGARTARTLLDRDPTRVAEPLEYVLALAEAGLAEMRALIFELLPDALEREGLMAALGKQAAALRARFGLAVTTALDAEPEASPAVKEALYRIAQEALHNTVKHAQARHVAVRLEAGAEVLILEVRDDGAGFDTGGAFPGHLGLQTMRERATRLGGTLELESAPGAGTRIRARVPAIV